MFEAAPDLDTLITQADAAGLQWWFTAGGTMLLTPPHLVQAHPDLVDALRANREAIADRIRTLGGAAMQDSAWLDMYRDDWEPVPF
jgi:hypothetical protein